MKQKEILTNCQAIINYLNSLIININRQKNTKKQISFKDSLLHKFANIEKLHQETYNESLIKDSKLFIKELELVIKELSPRENESHLTEDKALQLMDILYSTKIYIMDPNLRNPLNSLILETLAALEAHQKITVPFQKKINL